MINLKERKLKVRAKVMIADDHVLIRKGFISLLRQLRTIEVIDEAGNGKELMDKLKLKVPEIIILNYKMPLMDGGEALQLIKRRYPTVKVIMISSHDNINFIMDLVSKGANGFVSKASSPETLFNTITRVQNEGHYFESRISQMMITGLVNERNKRDKIDKTSLTGRELSILKEICDGGTNCDISKKLYIASSTVDFHRKNIYRKTNARSIVDLVKYAFRNGILQVT
jgi:DNA-binding NarL/FixJ family response regulator